jgi:hypothetical protein
MNPDELPEDRPSMIAKLLWPAGKEWFANASFKSRMHDLASDGLSRLVAVAEGDSWFDYPPHFDLLDALQSQGDVNVWRESHYGDTMEEMRKEQLKHTLAAVRRIAPDVFLLSCGGNDIMNRKGGIFDRFLSFAKDRKYPTGPYLKEAEVLDTFDRYFDRWLTSIIEEAKEAAIRAGRPDMRIFIHGYDYGFPDGRALFGAAVPRLQPGPWLSPALQRCGYFAELCPTDEELAIGYAAIRELIDYYNDFLRRLVTKRNDDNVVYVDLRGNLPDRRSHWHNETHPTAPGFDRLGRVLNDAILRSMGRG